MRKQAYNSIKRLLVEESGPTAVEYAVLLALIVVVCLGSIQSLAMSTQASFDSSANAITAAL